MKPKLLVLLLMVAALLAAVFPPPARADEEVSFDFFYKSLHPYGEWVDAGGDYGLVWHPSDVAEDWAPYTDGYWAYTDSGWTWVSYEDFGGIVYHYGRWVKLEDEGWCWVPDYDWGPAWVSWRNSDEYVGWAPLPPEAHYRPETGFSTWVDTSYDIGPGAYRFCNTADFGAPVIREVLLPRERNVVIIRNSVNITNITVNNFGRPFLGGPRFDVISTRVARPIPTLKIVQETNINNFITNNRGSRGPVFASVQRGNTLVMPAPVVRRPQNFEAIRTQYQPAKVLTAKPPQRGWDLVKAPEERQALKAEFTKQDKGATPQSAPARKFAAEEVASVPKTADPTAQVPVKGHGRENKPGRPETAGPAGTPGTEAPQGGFVKPGGEHKPGMKENPPVAVATPEPGNPATAAGKGKNKNRPMNEAATPVAPVTTGEPGATPVAPGGKNKNKNRPVPETTTPAAPGATVEPVAPNPRRNDEPRRMETPAVPANPVTPGAETRPATPERSEVPDRPNRKGGFVAPGEAPATEVPRGREVPGVEAPRNRDRGTVDAPRERENPGATEAPHRREVPETMPQRMNPPGGKPAVTNPNAVPQKEGKPERKGEKKPADTGMIDSGRAERMQAAVANQQAERAARQQQQAALANREAEISARQQQQVVAAKQAREMQAERQAAAARNVERPVQRSQAVAATAPAKGGGRHLTKEELEALKKQQGR